VNFVIQGVSRPSNTYIIELCRSLGTIVVFHARVLVLLLQMLRGTVRRGAGLPLVALTLVVLLLASVVGEHFDRDALTFAPDGTLKQVEYAAARVAKGPLCVGVSCKDGVVRTQPPDGRSWRMAPSCRL
jgi:hypothetical protein